MPGRVPERACRPGGRDARLPTAVSQKLWESLGALGLLARGDRIRWWWCSVPGSEGYDVVRVGVVYGWSSRSRVVLGWRGLGW